MTTTLDIFFYISNSLFLLASYPLIKEALRNRNSLKGFSFRGALYTFLGMITTVAMLIYIKSYWNVLLSLPTVAYWGIVTWYNRK